MDTSPKYSYYLHTHQRYNVVQPNFMCECITSTVPTKTFKTLIGFEQSK